jgi:hypothetical protein
MVGRLRLQALVREQLDQALDPPCEERGPFLRLPLRDLGELVIEGGGA